MRLLFLSVLANLVLLVALALRPALAPPTVREFLVRRFHFSTATTVQADAPASAKPAAATAANRAPGPASPRPLLGAAFATEDFAVMTARMKAAGFPPGVIGEIARREVDARYSARINALLQLQPDKPFWQTSPDAIAASGRISAEVGRLNQEREKAYRDAVNDPFFFQDAALDIGQRRMWGDLPRAKLDRIQRIEDDYADMMSATRTAANGVLLQDDQQKLALLEREKQADIAALLSPEEVAEYKLRTGSAGVASRLRLFEPTETEYRVIAQAAAEANARIATGGNSPPNPEQRLQVFQAFEAQMKAALGEARYAEMALTTNPEFQALNQMAETDRLPASNARQAFGVRDQAARESNRIFDDPALDAAQKRAALQLLAQNTRNQLLAVLGPTSGPAYVRMSDSWLNNVANGSAVSFANTSPLGGTSTSFRRLPGSTAPAAPTGVFIRSP